VRQLHLHLIARQQDDLCWPQPVWSNYSPQPLTAELALAQPWLQTLLAQLERENLGS
jgi:diadenosine tetraphosphate (Ap4A) HIT family hydrolase